MGRLTPQRELIPEQRLLGDSYAEAIRGSSVGDQVEVVSSEEVGRLLKDLLQAPRGSALLVGEEEKSEGVGRFDPQLPHPPEGEEGGDDILVVVLRSPAEDPALLHIGLKGVSLPEGELFHGFDVEAVDDPESLLALTSGDLKDEVGSKGRRGVDIRERELEKLSRRGRREEFAQEVGLSALPDSPVAGRKGGNRR